MMRHTVMLLVLATAVVGCEEIPVPIAVSCPSEADYVDYVSPVLEKRCGTLDCHGQLGRPLKFYSQNGLRLFTEDEFNDPALARDAGTIPGGKATTDNERLLNRWSLCGVEPEKMNQLAAGGITPDELLVIRKPLGVERHKGGELFIKGQEGYVCVTSWLSDDTNITDCEAAVLLP